MELIYDVIYDHDIMGFDFSKLTIIFRKIVCRPLSEALIWVNDFTFPVNKSISSPVIISKIKQL